MKGWKYRPRELLKAIFCPPKTIKKQTGSAWNFLQTSVQVCRGAYIPYFKINSPIFCCPQVFEGYLNHQVGMNTNDKRTCCRLPPHHPTPLELTSRIHTLMLLWTPKRFICPECFLNFFSNLYDPPWLPKQCQFYGVEVTEKYIYESKNLIWSFLRMSPSKTFPQVLINTPQVEGYYPFPQTALFENLFLAKQTEGRSTELKKWPKLNLWGYWSETFINSTIFVTFALLISVLLCHNLNSSMLKCKGIYNKFSRKSIVCRNNYIKDKTLP